MLYLASIKPSDTVAYMPIAYSSKHFKIMIISISVVKCGDVQDYKKVSFVNYLSCWWKALS